MTTVNTIPIKTYPPIVTFDVTPHGAVVAIATTIASYSWADLFRHATATSLTFTATVTDGYGATVTEYFWNFGDGVTALGNGATHTYLYANPATVATLRATMSDGRVGYAQMNLMLT